MFLFNPQITAGRITTSTPSLRRTRTARATALISRTSWSSNAKRWLVIGLAVAFTIAGVIFAYRPDVWTEVGVMAAVTVGVAQTIYAILKPTGALDWLSEKTESPKRAEPDAQ